MRRQLKARIIRTIIRGCKKLHFDGFPNKRQLMLMARYPATAGYILRCLSGAET